MSALLDDPRLQQLIADTTGAEGVALGNCIQSLWSGYGEIRRLQLSGSATVATLVIKHISTPESVRHPRGWHSDRSHRRKLRSYEVEMNWYRHWANRCDSACRVPHCHGSIEEPGLQCMVLEDLDAAGFGGRRESVSERELHLCLSWLAHFHGRFLQCAPKGLWPIGGYWHIDTRPDEWTAMAEGPLKSAATAIDRQLRQARYQTLIHGDAKLANFCFGSESVAAVDFQYVGAGVGISDIAYFLGSCLDSDDCERLEQPLLEYYFSELRQAVAGDINVQEFTQLEREWRRLYALAWADFERFLSGWMPGHKKMTAYSRRLTEQVLATLSI